MFRKSLFKYFSSELGFGKSFLLGFLISASGSFLLGGLHLMAIQINVEKGWQAAIMFSSGCALVEALFVWGMIPFTRWLGKVKNGLVVMEWVLLILFLGLSIACFYLAMHVNQETKQVLTYNIAIPTFLLGVGVRMIYPNMIPFWLAWNTVLVTRKVRFQILPFILATGLATIIFHGFFIFIGQLLIDFLRDKGQAMMLVIGVLFLVTAIIQIKRVKKSQGVEFNSTP